MIEKFYPNSTKIQIFWKVGQNSKWALIERLDGRKLSCRKILEGEHDNIISLIWSRCACKVRDLLRLKSHTIIIEMLFGNSIWLSLFDFFIHTSQISTVLIKQLIATVGPNWPFYLDLTLFLKSGFRPNLITLVEMGHRWPNQTINSPSVRSSLKWVTKN